MTDDLVSIEKETKNLRKTKKRAWGNRNTRKRTVKRSLIPEKSPDGFTDGVKTNKNISIYKPDALITTEEKKKKVIWQPFPGPQVDFLSADEDEVLFSGGRGSGKSDSFLVDPLRYVTDSNFRGLILRRTMPALKDLIRGAKELYFQAFPTCKWREQEKMFVFPSGASIDFGYLDSIDDCERYHGQEYSWLGIDEISQFPDISWYYKLKGSIRSTKMRTKIRCCVDEGDVLTKRGWIDIKDIIVGDIVYSLTSDGTLVEKEVYSTSKYDIEENLVRIKKKNLYVSMTQDHRVLKRIFNKKGGSFELCRWNEDKNKSIALARCPLEYNNIGYTGYTFNGMSPEAFISFLGIYLAEGSIAQKPHKGNYSICVTQLKEKNFEVISNLLKLTGIKWCYCANGDFKATNKEFWTYLKQFGKSKDKFVPQDILNTANKEQLQLLLDWLFLGDGNWQTETSGTYVTTSKLLCDNVQEIALKLGYKTQFSTFDDGYSKHNLRYNVYISKNRPTTLVEKERKDCKQQVYTEPYKGFVYCISVKDTENFVIRQRGCVHITGNTSNPTGVGRSWVKEYWIDAGPANTTIVEEIDSPFGKLRTTKKWIHSTIRDNPALMNSPQYLAVLASLQEPLRSAWLDGSWDAIEGMAFPEFRKSLHVIPPFQIPNNWVRFRGLDWGYASPMCCLWLAVDYDNNLYVYREFATNGKISRDKGEEPITAEIAARKILELESGERVKWGVMDASCWQKKGDPGPSIAETFEMERCFWRQSDRSAKQRETGKLELHRLLKLDETTKKPKIFIFDTCKYLIKCLSSLPVDESNPEDVDTKAWDHEYDALRYALMSRPYMANSWDDWLNKAHREKPVIVDPAFGY